MVTETHTGIQGIDISTSAFLFNPKEAFFVTHEINRSLPQKEWVQVELYPFSSIPRLNRCISALGSKKAGPSFVFNPEITEEKVRSWQDDYPCTKVSRVHLPFAYNTREAWLQALRPTSQTVKLKGQNNIHHIFYALFLGSAINMRGTNLARSLGDQQVGLTVHANVAARFTLSGKIQELTQGVSYVLLENSPKFSYPGIKNQADTYDPRCIVKNIIKPHQEDFTGLLLGLEHLADAKINVDELLKDKDIQLHTQAVHLAGDQHEAADASQSIYRALLSRLNQTEFTHPIRLVLDYSPFQFMHLSPAEKVDFFDNNIRKIRECLEPASV